MSDFLTLLPPEIRNTIYEYALLRPEVYPYEYGTSVHAVTNTGEESGETSSVSRHDLQIISGNRSTGGYDSPVENTGMPQTINARLNPPSTALQCTCKRFHLEATAMVYTGNKFVFFDPESCQRFYDNAPRHLFNAITDIRIDPWLLVPRVGRAVIKVTLKVIRILRSMRGVKHLQLMFRTFRPRGDLGRFGRAQILVLLDERWHLSSGVDMLNIYEHLGNPKNEVLFDYQHLQDVECAGFGSRGPRSMRGHGKVKLFINGSKTLEWEQACA